MITTLEGPAIENSPVGAPQSTQSALGKEGGVVGLAERLAWSKPREPVKEKVGGNKNLCSVLCVYLARQWFPREEPRGPSSTREDAPPLEQERCWPWSILCGPEAALFVQGLRFLCLTTA